MKSGKIPDVKQTLETVEASVETVERYLRMFKSRGRKGVTRESGGAQLKASLPGVPGCDILLTQSGKVLQRSPRFNNFFGLPAPRGGAEEQVLDFIPEHMQGFFLQQWNTCGSKGLIHVNILHASGYEVPVQFLVTKQNGHILIDVEDHSFRKQLEEELQISRESYSILAETAIDAIIQIRFDFSIQFANSAVSRVFGYERELLQDRHVSILFPESRYSQYEEIFIKYFFIDDTHRQESGLQNTVEVLGKRKDGELVPLEISFGNSRGVKNNRILTCIIRDIALRKKAERRLKYLAYHDKLTSLGNRDRLSDSLDQLLAEIRRQPERHAALLFLDLDGFKKVNDSLGHEKGDLILKECARRLSNCIREEDRVYRIQMEDIFRLGGDEFTILLPHIGRPEDAAVVARRIIDRILEPFTVQGYRSVTDISLGVSIGVALIPEDGMDKTILLRNADAAMYNAKEIGNTYLFFTAEMNNKAVERLVLEEGLRKSIGDKDFELYYQPIVDGTGRIKGLEALIRWMHPERGLVSPGRFIDVAENTRLILPIGRWVLETAFNHLKYWNDLGLNDMYVSVNISPIQLEKEDISVTVRSLLQKLGISAENIVLELTETSLMENPESAIKKMNKLLNLNKGLRIAVDDFGTGYSSLSYLSRLPVHNLKIDRAFVSGLGSENNIKIINSIVSLGKSLDMNVIAEGVETAEQLEFLIEKGCETFQGYYFSKPLTFTEITAYIQERGISP